MRTTVEITDEQRAQLMRLAARRGLKGFSVLVQEAIDLYLASGGERAAKVKAALGMEGSLSEDEARALSEATRSIRRSWR